MTVIAVEKAVSLRSILPLAFHFGSYFLSPGYGSYPVVFVAHSLLRNGSAKEPRGCAHPTHTRQVRSLAENIVITARNDS